MSFDGETPQPVNTSPAMKRSPLANLRDLGGTPLSSGFVRPEVLFRSDDLSLSPPEELQDLVDLGLRSILDLRSAEEQALRPHLNLADLGVAHHVLSLSEGAIDPETAAARMMEIRTPADLGSWYAQMAEDAAPILVRGLQILADAQGASLFHCAAGKDRTGVFSAAILSVLGADDEAIVEDYAATDLVIGDVLVRLSQVFVDETSQSQPWPDDILTSESPLLRAHAETAQFMLEDLQRRSGGMVDLLRRAGLDDSTFGRLQERFVV
jgi:protein-tyrosine phosphatase